MQHLTGDVLPFLHSSSPPLQGKVFPSPGVSQLFHGRPFSHSLIFRTVTTIQLLWASHSSLSSLSSLQRKLEFFFLLLLLLIRQPHPPPPTSPVPASLLRLSPNDFPFRRHLTPPASRRPHFLLAHLCSPSRSLSPVSRRHRRESAAVMRPGLRALGVSAPCSSAPWRRGVTERDRPSSH